MPRAITLTGKISTDTNIERERLQHQDEILWHTLRMLDYHWRNGFMTREDVLQSVRDAVSGNRGG